MMYFSAYYEVTPGMDDDMLHFYFYTDAPTSTLADGSVLIQWAQFAPEMPTDDNIMKVACKIVIGDDP